MSILAVALSLKSKRQYQANRVPQQILANYNTKLVLDQLNSSIPQFTIEEEEKKESRFKRFLKCLF